MKMTDNPSRKNVKPMFNRIAARYDFLNHVLSFGMDIWWRKKLGDAVPRVAGRVLDLATGSGDVLVSLKKRKKITSGVGVDISQNMLNIAHKKIQQYGFKETLRVVEADARNLPFVDSAFDAATIAFGIRNIADADKGLAEMHRVLRPGGTALIMEFSLPKWKPFRVLYLWYLRHVLPKIGGVFSGDKDAYTYLNKTIETFPYGKAFVKKMQKAGFRDVDVSTLTFGTVTIYKAKK